MIFKKKSVNIKSSNSVLWIDLISSEQLTESINNSQNKPQLIFKHSTRCSISSMAKARFEREWKLTPEQCDVYYLDLITYRSVSNQVAEVLNVVHQSPQAILVIKGKVVYHSSHNMIEADKIKKIVEGFE